MMSKLQRRGHDTDSITTSVTKSASVVVIPECEVFWEGGDGPTQKQHGCPKHPGHTAFIPVDALIVDSLPPGCQTQENLYNVRTICDRTVKITVKSTSPNRPDTWPDSDNPYPYNYLKGSNRAWRVGTGFIYDTEIKRGRCPCHLCKERGLIEIKEYMEVRVKTASHVIYDDAEAVASTMECFYDTYDGRGVKTLYGVKMDTRYGGGDELLRCRMDNCRVTCVTHDEELMRKLVDVMKRSNNFLQFPFIVSHPHGGTKKLTVGNLSYIAYKGFDTFPRGVPHELKRLFDYGRMKIWIDVISTTVTCRLLVPLPQPDNHPPTSDVTQPDDSPSSQKDQGCNNTKSQEEEHHESGILLTPGVEHEIPVTTTFTLPQDADYLYRSRKDGYDWWMTFPPGTKFTLPDGRLLPPQTEFKWLDDVSLERCYNYDIPTCPGSSGARVYGAGFSWIDWYGVPHSGASLKDSTNQSAWIY